MDKNEEQLVFDILTFVHKMNSFFYYTEKAVSDLDRQTLHLLLRSAPKKEVQEIIAHLPLIELEPLIENPLKYFPPQEKFYFTLEGKRVKSIKPSPDNLYIADLYTLLCSNKNLDGKVALILLDKILSLPVSLRHKTPALTVLISNGFINLNDRYFVFPLNVVEQLCNQSTDGDLNYALLTGTTPWNEYLRTPSAGKSIPELLIRKMAINSNRWVRMNIVARENVPLDIVEELAQDSCEDVRMTTIENNKVQSKTLIKLLNNKTIEKEEMKLVLRSLFSKKRLQYFKEDINQIVTELLFNENPTIRKRAQQHILQK